MFLRDIDPVSSRFNILTDASMFNLSGLCTSFLYLTGIGKYSTGEIKKVRIELYTQIFEKSELPRPFPEEIKTCEIARERVKAGTYHYQNYIDDLIDVVIIHRRFDFEKWFNASKNDKKKLIIEEMHNAMLLLAEHFAWEKQPLINAFEYCESKNFETCWHPKHFKAKIAPNKKYKAAIFVEYDLDEFRFFASVQDSQSIEIQRLPLYTVSFQNGFLKEMNEINSILKGKIAWQNNDFVLFDKNAKEIARVTIS